jgi:hypothetical protein
LVLLETVILEADDQPLIRRTSTLLKMGILPVAGPKLMPVRVPASATRKGVSGNVYDEYRLGLASACTDAVLVKMVSGNPKVPLIRRAQPPFAGAWWITGGANYTYRPVPHFALWKVHKEYGLDTSDIDEFVTKHGLADDECSYKGVHIIGPIGFVRTAADDTGDPAKVCDTFNLCVLAVIHGNEQELCHDKDHSDIWWMGKHDLEPGCCGHWYPEWAVRKALGIVQQAFELAQQ